VFGIIPAKPPATDGRPQCGASLVILYDGGCSVCTGSVRYIESRDVHGEVECADLRDPDSARRFPEFSPEAVRALMHGVDTAGEVTVGIDAVRQLGGRLPWWRRVAWLLGVPGFREVGSVAYQLLARNRYVFNPLLGDPPCADDACAVDWTDVNAP